jgi:hypothetical protein
MMPKLPEPNFKLIWRGGQYWVSKPNIDGTDVYTPETVRAIQEEAYKAGMAAAVPDGWRVVSADALNRWMAAFAEELAAWDIDPPIHHVKTSHDEIAATLSASPEVK